MVRGLALVSLLAALPVPAARAGGYSVGVTGGLAAPMSDFKDAFNSGWNLGCTADHSFNALWGAGIDAGLHSWNGSSAFEGGLKAEALLEGADPGTTIDVQLTALQYGVHVTLTPAASRPIHPYVRLGAGGYDLKQAIESNDPDFVMDESKNLFGWNAGVGAEFTMTPTLSLGLDGIYHNVRAKDEFGADATWIGVNGMLTFHIPLAK
jgi:opacity protein-like surface antigen